MSNNVILTPKVMARLVLMDLGGGLKVAKNMSTAITQEFAKPEYKVGETVQVRKPYRFAGHDGIGWNPEPTVDQVTPISVRQVAGVHWFWDSIERTLEVREAMRLYAHPVGLALSSKINAYAATFAGNNALHSVGTPGTAPTSEATYLAAGDRLVETGLPDNEEVTLIVNRKMSTAFVSGVKALFNDAGSIGRQWKTGEMQNSLGYKIERDQTINVRTNGAWVTAGLVNLAQTADGGNNATMTLNTDGWGSGTTNLKEGDRFIIGSSASATVGGVESVHPQTRVSTGAQQVFTIRADISDTTGTLNMVVSPAITPATLPSPGNQYANVNIAAPDNGIITMIGTTALSGITQGLLLHENAFAFVSVPLWNPPTNGVIAAEREKDDDTGLNISYISYLDGDNRQQKHRFDCLYDVGNLYRELACVIQA